MSVCKIEKAVISAKQNILEIFWTDSHKSRFHSCWLRYNCRCKKCLKTVVGEDTVNLVDFSDQLTVESVKIGPSSDELFIMIGGDIKKDHVTYMDADWLRSMCYCDQCLHSMIKERDMVFHPITTKPTVEYATLSSDETKFKFLQYVFDVGFVIITGVPSIENQVLKIAEELGIVTETTYGKIFNVFDNVEKSEHFAYAPVALPTHSDQCQYEAGPGIQLLHALRFDECVEGGESQLVDMFQAIECLRQESPDDFRVLTRVPCTYCTIDFNRKVPAYFIIRKPIIEVDYDDQVVSFAWNRGLENTLRIHEDDVEPFYRAYKKMQSIVERKSLIFEHRLKEGELLVLNNRRFIHGRSSYRSNGGLRKLQGCYMDAEEMKSNYVILGERLGKEVRIRKIGNRSAL